MSADPVQISDVGERRYLNNAICHQAVVQGISKSQLICILIDEHDRLCDNLTRLYQRRPPDVMIIPQPNEQRRKTTAADMIDPKQWSQG